MQTTFHCLNLILIPDSHCSATDTTELIPRIKSTNPNLIPDSHKGCVNSILVGGKCQFNSHTMLWWVSPRGRKYLLTTLFPPCPLVFTTCTWHVHVGLMYINGSPILFLEPTFYKNVREVCGYTMYSFLREWWWPRKGPTHARRFDKFVLIRYRLQIECVVVSRGFIFYKNYWKP